MKSKKKAKAKTRSRSKIHAKTTTKARAKTQTRNKLHAPPLTSPESITSPSLTLNSMVKTCQEVEVGDIGGFGSPDELEEHEKRCSEPATEFCGSCGKTLCQSHYDLIHRDHDHQLGHTTNSPSGPTLV